MKYIKIAILSTFLAASSLLSADNLELIKQAQSGNAEAQYKVAGLYSSGKIGNNSLEDKKIMIQWLEKSAQQGYLKAQEILAYKYLEADNKNEAYKWAKKAIDQNSTNCKSIMSYLYFFGTKDLPMDKAAALKQAQETSSNSISKIVLGLFHFNGYFDIEKNLKKTKEYALEAINKKCSLGYRLLFLYYLNEYMENDKEHNSILIEKEKILSKIKENNHDLAIYLCAYWNFLTKSKNKDEILSDIKELLEKENEKVLYLAFMLTGPKNKFYLMKAAENDFIPSYAFAWLFKIPNASSANTDEEAYKIAEKAIKSGNPKAFTFLLSDSYKVVSPNDSSYPQSINQEQLTKIGADNGGTYLQYNYAQSNKSNKDIYKKYLKEAARKKYPNASSELAIFLKDNNDEKWIYWAKQAAENREQDGLLLYAQYLTDTQNPNHDYEKGFEYYQTAALFGNKKGAIAYSHANFAGFQIKENPVTAYVYAKISENKDMQKITTDILLKRYHGRIDEVEALYQKEQETSQKLILLQQEVIESKFDALKLGLDDFKNHAEADMVF